MVLIGVSNRRLRQKHENQADFFNCFLITLSFFHYFSSMKLILAVALTLAGLRASAQSYFQQRVDTRIEVSLDDKHHTLAAYEEFSYTNNSPDTLRYLYVHLWPNAYKNDHTPFAKQEDRNGKTAFYHSNEAAKGYIDSLQFTVDGVTADHFITEDIPDIARLDLPRPLYPGKTIKVATPFKVKVPLVFSRMGHTKQAYFISQWFPKPAVYDRKGWHAISYLDQGEFFSEYGSYDVTITLPKNYVVMATGNCTDKEENDWLDKKAAEPLPSDTLYKSGWFPASVAETKTIHFHEDNVHDFAWFADKRWAVMKDTVYAPGTHHLVTTWSAFLPSYQKYWKKSNYYLKETIRDYGKWVGPYPYNTVKAVLGDMHAGGGMEYPTVTIIDKNASSSLKTVVVHEAGHNWFYGMLGSMERDHAWMDEGMNTFYEKKTTRAIPNDTIKEKQQGISISGKGLTEELLYNELAKNHEDQVIDQNADNFISMNYGIDVYNKTALMMKWLEQYMDSTHFQEGMHDYFDTWKCKHPYPEDFMARMARHTSKPIDWFRMQGLNTTTPVDYKVTHTATNDHRTDITIKNRTGFSGPAIIDVRKGDSTIAKVMTEPFTGSTTVSTPVTDWTSLRVDKAVPDCVPQNDLYSRYGMFHNFHPHVKLFLGIDNKPERDLFVSPAIGYNQYDGFMAGLVFHDITLPENRFRFLVAPLYGVNSGSLVGTGTAGYIWFGNGLFKDVMAQVDGKTFNYADAPPNLISNNELRFVKIAPSLNFTFNNHDDLSPVRQTLIIKAYFISEQQTLPNADTTAWSLQTQQKTYGSIVFRHKNERTYNPFSYRAELQGGADFAKLNVEGDIRIDYNKPKKALYLRGYFGKFFAINNDPNITSRYELNATYSGVNDYLYDGTFMGRTSQNTNAGQQISMQEGGFKIPVFNNAARSDNWMGTINLETDLPRIKYPVLLFFDAGLIPNDNPSFAHSQATSMLYDGGIEVRLIKGVASLYIPLLRSADFDNYLVNTYGRSHAFARSISFTLDIQNFNWLKSPLTNIKLG